jgi:alpha-L-fucosidase
MYQPGSPANKHHVATYGDPATFGFKDFIPLLNGSKFDPKAWAALYRKAGAQYAGPVTAFADGFFMFDSAHTDYNAAKMGPKRDVVGEVVAAVRAEGLKVVTSLHHNWLWSWYTTWNTSLASDAANPKYQLTADHGGLYGPGIAKLSDIPAQCYPYLGGDNCSVTEGVEGAFAINQRFMDYWLAIAQEVAAKYKPDVMWLDSHLRATVDGAHRTRFLADFYNDALGAQQEVVVTYKGTDMRPGAGVLDYERGGVGDIQSSVWQTDDSMDRSCWCWCEPLSLKPQSELVGELVDIVSKGGNFLLNAPPRPDGSFDERVVAPLLGIGKWLEVSGAGIYKTVPWRVYGEGPTKISPGSFHEWPTFTGKDFRFTAAPDGKAVFVFLMAWTSSTSFAVTSLNNSTGTETAVTDVTILGSDRKVSWRADATALHVDAIAELPPGMQADCAVGLRVHFARASVREIDGPTAAMRARITQK